MKQIDLYETAQVSVVNMPRTDKIKLSPMRLRSMQASVRKDLPAAPEQPLKPLLHCLFMETMRYYHDHLDQSMPSAVRNALSRVHDGSQGLFADSNVLFLDLRTIQDSPAGREHAKLVQAALESLFSR